jgi:hypothetical protein
MSADPYRPESGKIATTRTLRFMESVLNNGRHIPMEIEYNAARQMVRNPAITEQLHELGYTFYNVASWYTETDRIENADYNLKLAKQTWYDHVFTGEFNYTFWGRTILSGLNIKALMPTEMIIRTEGLRHIWQVMTTVDLAADPGQKFVLLHLMLPHEPFVWDADGNLQDGKLSTKDAYYEQMRFTRDYLVSLADGIISNDTDAIVIIQSDEGMAYRKPVELNYDLTLTQWNGVLTAWRLPYTPELDDIPHTGILKYVLEGVK